MYHCNSAVHILAGAFLYKTKKMEKILLCTKQAKIRGWELRRAYFMLSPDRIKKITENIYLSDHPILKNLQNFYPKWG